MFQFLSNLRRMKTGTNAATFLYGESAGQPVKFAAGAVPIASGGSVPAAVVPYVVASEVGNGVVNQTLLTLTALPLTLRDTEQGGGAKIWTFPVGYIARIGAHGTVAMTTTSAILSTLNGNKDCNWGVGSTTQANGTLATTEQDIIQTTTIKSSSTINVAAAASTGVGAGVLAALDGSGTAIDAYFNVGVATGTDIDADATVTITGTVKITWALL